MKSHLLPLMVLLALTAAVYASSTGHDFIHGWDDDAYVTANEAVKGFSSANLRKAFTAYYVGNYAPVQIISYMLDYSLWGMKAAGFIFTNIVLHALNGLLYYYLLIRITARRIWAFLAASIFLLHPVQVESVAWISQRKNLLAMFFFLVSFLLYIAYRDSGFGTRDQEKPTQNSKLKTQNFFYAGSVASFVLALLAKSVAVVLPPVLLLYDICFVVEKGRQRWLLDKLPFIAVAAVVALVALNSQIPEYYGGRTGYHGGAPLATFLTMLPVFVRYLGLLFWPADLSAVYDPPIKTGIDLAVVLSAVLVASLCAGGVFLYRRRKDLFFWGALFAVGLLPVSQIVPLVTLMNDRYLYFPMLGAAALFAGVAASGLDLLSENPKKTALALICLLLITLSLLSFSRAKVWQDPFTLWKDASQKAPGSILAWNALGSAYHRNGKPDIALPLYERALSLAPLHRETLHNISVLYLESGQFRNAHNHLMKLIDRYPQFAPGYLTLGNYYYDTGNLQEAETAYQRALSQQPGYGSALRNLGDLYYRMRKTEQARELYHQAIKSGGESAELYYNLAMIEAVRGRAEDSLAHLKAALILGFNNRGVLVQYPLRNMPAFRQMLEEYLQK